MALVQKVLIQNRFFLMTSHRDCNHMLPLRLTDIHIYQDSRKQAGSWQRVFMYWLSKDGKYRVCMFDNNKDFPPDDDDEEPTLSLKDIQLQVEKLKANHKFIQLETEKYYQIYGLQLAKTFDCVVV